jgi:hypothetical protein
MASLEQFNDPFDCNVKLLEVTDHQELAQEVALACQLLENDSRLLKNKEQFIADIKQKLSHLQQGQKDKELLQAIEDTRQELIDTGIFCASRKHTDILMWSHYAKSHTGICIEFDVEKLRQIPGILALPIQYAESVNIYLRNIYSYVFAKAWMDEEKVLAHNPIHVIASTKYHCWCYEEEYRFLLPGKAKQLVDLPAHTVRSVVFGSRVSKTDEALVRAVLEKWPTIKFARAEEDPRKFAVNIKFG